MAEAYADNANDGGFRFDSDIDFVYTDFDTHANEMAELYAYSEEEEFFVNRDRFYELMEDYGLPLKWADMTKAQQQRVLELLSNLLEVSDEQQRHLGIRLCLYLVQGVFGECTELDQQAKYARENVFLLYENDFFPQFVHLLNKQTIESNVSYIRPCTMAESIKMRMILNVLYTFVEVMLRETEDDLPHWKGLREQFREELSHPIAGTNELLAITLFQMTSMFCNHTNSPLPIKKIILLLWKVILASLGGTDELRNLKNKYRANVNLKPVPDDTLEVVKNMTPCSSLLQLYDLLDEPKGKFSELRSVNRRKGPVFKRQMSVSKFGGKTLEQSAALDEDGNDSLDETLEGENGETKNGETENGDEVEVENEESNENSSEANEESDANKSDEIKDTVLDTTVSEGECESESDATTDSEEGTENGKDQAFSNLGWSDESKDESSKGKDDLTEGILTANLKSLPWTPKVRNADLDHFLNQARERFIGFSLPNDRETLAGLPQPIIESFKILNKHVYVSLSELQIEREEEFLKYPITTKELDESTLNSPAERLYKAMLPNVSHYMVNLLKILFAAASTSKIKSDSMNVTADMMPVKTSIFVLENLKLSIDVNRHKEIIVKAVSAIILLLLKHYKINHIYQFEHLCQQLLFANCIPLILKYFSQNVNMYVCKKNNISVIDFPSCVIGEQTELTNEILEMGCFYSAYCWRNLFSLINLLRIMVKLNKWKNIRIASLILLKSHSILRKALRVPQATLQLYVLKLFKLQTRNLGRQWRKTNMKILGAIYQRVRHRFNDGWALNNVFQSNELQYGETELQNKIALFHKRRYGSKDTNNRQSFDGKETTDFLVPGIKDTPLSQLFGEEIELSRDFKRNYRDWLKSEVFNNQIDWDLLLNEDACYS